MGGCLLLTPSFSLALSFQCQITLKLTCDRALRSVVEHCSWALCWHGTLLDRLLPHACVTCQSPKGGGEGSSISDIFTSSDLFQHILFEDNTIFF